MDVHEEYVGFNELITLQENQYCSITNPVDPKTGKILYGKRKLVVGETFFQLPGMYCIAKFLPITIIGELLSEIKKAFVLSENDALKVKAKENFDEEKGVKRQSGDEWLIIGPKYGKFIIMCCLQ